MPANILVFAPNWIGDAAMCTPAIRALHRRFPEAAITVAGRASVCDLLDCLPGVVQTVPLPKGGAFAMAKAAARLRPYARELAVIFPHSFRAAWLAWLAGARVRLGYNRNRRGFLLTDKIEPYRENGHIQPVYMTKEYIHLVTSLGCEDDGRGLELRLAPAPIKHAQSFLGEKRPIIGIASGAAFGPSKLWPAERYAHVADALMEKTGGTVVMLTGPGEEETRDAVLAAARRPILTPNAELKGIEGLKAIVSQLDLMVCNDSGTRHVAVAFDVPTVCIMGPTSARYSTGPYERGRVLRIDVPCGPCQKPVCTTDHRCMTGISEKLVLQTALDVLKSEAAKGSTMGIMG